MTVPTRTFDTAAELGATLASRVLDELAAARADGRRYVLGCPGGRSLSTTYAALARLAAERAADLDPLVIAMMDEYAVPAPGADGGFAPIDPAASHSCRRFGLDHILGPLGLPATRLLMPDTADPAAYDDQLRELGGIDLFLLATGSSDGHVAFNPPGTDRTSSTRVIELAETTRTDNLSTFPDLRVLADVPTHGVTVGVGTIADLSRAAVLVACGAEKRAAVRRISTATAYDASWPATVLHACRAAELYLDRDATTPEPTERQSWPA